MMNYNNEYKAYYESLKSKVKNIKVKENGSKILEREVTPIRRVGQAKSYSGRYKGYGANREGYRSRIKDEKKKFKFIDKMILRLIVTLLLFLCIFIFKISPNENIKVIYESFNKEINKSYDLTFVKNTIDKLGIDLDSIENLIEKIEDKTSEVMKEILD